MYIYEYELYIFFKSTQTNYFFKEFSTLGEGNKTFIQICVSCFGYLR